MLREDNVRTGFFEREQFESLRKHLPEHYRNLVTFCYITGWRSKSEVFPLQWRQVDFQAGVVRLEVGSTKSGKGRTFAFTTELRLLLEQQRELTDQIQKQIGGIIPLVFHRRGRPIREFEDAWRTACRAAGLPGAIKHDFRRTAVRNMVRAGISEKVAMEMTGHKTRSVFDRYDIVSEGDLRDAARKLDQLAGTFTGTISTQNVQQAITVKVSK